ncbi:MULTISPECIES: hypothetical protein [Enterobacterales]|uniref:hypothetical protein n=1 Tax=Enterobacterales TaxID=91347 RepID=UPI002ED8EB07
MNKLLILATFATGLLLLGCEDKSQPSEDQISSAISSRFDSIYSGLSQMDKYKVMAAAGLSFVSVKKLDNCKPNASDKDIVNCPVEIHFKRDSVQALSNLNDVARGVNTVYSSVRDLEMTRRNESWECDPRLIVQLQLSAVLAQ